MSRGVRGGFPRVHHAQHRGYGTGKKAQALYKQRAVYKLLGIVEYKSKLYVRVLMASEQGVNFDSPHRRAGCYSTTT